MLLAIAVGLDVGRDAIFQLEFGTLAILPANNLAETGAAEWVWLRLMSLTVRMPAPGGISVASEPRVLSHSIASLAETRMRQGESDSARRRLEEFRPHAECEYDFQRLNAEFTEAQGRPDRTVFSWRAERSPGKTV